MHRTQIYFEETLFEEIKREALKKGVSISAYIRDVLKKELRAKKGKKVDFNEIAGLWKERDIDIDTLRKDAWKK